MMRLVQGSCTIPDYAWTISFFSVKEWHVRSGLNRFGVGRLCHRRGKLRATLIRVVWSLKQLPYPVYEFYDK